MTDANVTTAFVFGGSFNPPHVSHTLALCAVKALANPAHILVVPTFMHPFSKALVAFEHRIAMCRDAFGWIPGVEISTIEQELGGESKTLRTLQHIQKMHPAWSLRLLVGADILGESSKWHGWEQIEKLAPPFVLGRQGVTEGRAPLPLLPKISSSVLRSKIAQGEDVSSFLSREVNTYIKQHGFYT
jgi:nicotinate-nucleotide adenylyltransferase